MFKYRHSSLHGVMEQTFGVLKATRKIVDDRIPPMSLESQIKIVISVCTLHNFICLHERMIQISPRPPCYDRRQFVALFDHDAKEAMKYFRNQIETSTSEGCPS